MNFINKKGQEEIVGFAVIIVIVVVVLLFFLSFYIRGDSSEGVESFEAASFIQSSLHFTTECEGNLGNYDVRRLISECSDESQCLDGRDACNVLESTLEDLINAGWQVGEDRPVKGYELFISSNQNNLINVSEGNITRNFRGTFQDYVLGDRIEISFRAYYE
ncbi:MAG: hypothetical protein WDZ62_01810 [Candidatus Pacearchaeota archaeon]